MREIPITKGYVVLVDDDDYESLSQYKWQANVNPNGRVYAQRSQWLGDGKQKTIGMHQQIMGFPGMVDHIDRNGLNNQKGNLRSCTHRENTANSIPYPSKEIPYKGVAREKNKFRARIMIEGKSFSLGQYETPEEAAIAYDIAAIATFGDFGRTNILGVEVGG